MIANGFKPLLNLTGTAATVSYVVGFVDPEAFRNAALTWIAVGSTLLFALISALSTLLPRFFALLERLDDYCEERRQRRLGRRAPSGDAELPPFPPAE